jgi:nucleoside-diphosphate-sugar epimerase
MSAVVLGHTGFLGRRVLEELSTRGVEAVGHSSATVDLRRFEGLRALDGALTPASSLFFASALTPDKGATLETLSANIAMVLNVARYLEAHPVRVCVYVSSDAVYPMTPAAVTEQSAVEPAAFYALAKYTGERVLQQVAQAKGLRLLVLRVTGVYGPGDTHGSYGPNLFVRSIAKERVLRMFGGGEETRDHVYVNDAARIAVDLAAGDASGVFNVATGESRTFASIAEDLRAVVPDAFTIESLPRRAPITHRRFDVSRLREALPELRFTPFRDGLAAAWAAVSGRS